MSNKKEGNFKLKNKLDLLQLIEEAKNSRQQAQSKIVNLFWSDIKSYIFSLVKDENYSEELTIETFTKVLSKLDLYNSDFDFRTWVTSIAHNSAIDFLRKKNKVKNKFLDDDYHHLRDCEPSPEQLFIDKQNLEAFEKRLNNLPENYRKLIYSRYIDGKKLKDIVEETGLSLANVKVSLMRARKLLS
ncbi:RNA polymerase sigma-70 factor, ECF subfamily [Apibacter mensalis]|uniref:RNA polymerase sigma-70 factor, ECF subfamily n=1 Tax=Apibacter mensalis TaxID=1586267 RepID=A0A0X3ARI1_9FLAO|nr:sigma-70 family RNA polymerase sigma factor [Apibacter mensalis]CVK17011.1 RNA polymerase sigma-70 factor, ECF subfamily [Apibacter mensalis]